MSNVEVRYSIILNYKRQSAEIPPFDIRHSAVRCSNHVNFYTIGSRRKDRSIVNMSIYKWCCYGKMVK